MKLRNLFLIIFSFLILLTPCSIKASIQSIFKVELVSQKNYSSSKTVQNKTTQCSAPTFNSIQKNDNQFDFHYADLKINVIPSINLPRSSVSNDESNTVEYISSKIPFYLLYKQLKFSLF